MVHKAPLTSHTCTHTHTHRHFTVTHRYPIITCTHLHTLTDNSQSHTYIHNANTHGHPMYRLTHSRIPHKPRHIPVHTHSQTHAHTPRPYTANVLQSGSGVACYFWHFVSLNVQQTCPHLHHHQDASGSPHLPMTRVPSRAPSPWQ